MIPPKVSVIMPCYNVSHFIDYALVGLQNQIYKNFEVIAVDDGSTDDTPTHLAQAQGEFDLKIINCQTNRGLPTALNIGMSNATGAFIARFDPDDFMKSYRIRDQVYYLLEKPEVDLIGGGAEVFGMTELTITPRVSHTEIKDEFLFNNPFLHPTIMFRRHLLDRGLYQYREDLKTDEDYELWSRLIPKINTANLHYPLIRYRIHSTNGQRNPGKKAVKELAIRQYFSAFEIDEPHVAAVLAEYQCSGFLSHDGFEALKDYVSQTEHRPRLGAIHEKLNRSRSYRAFMADLW